MQYFYGFILSLKDTIISFDTLYAVLGSAITIIVKYTVTYAKKYKLQKVLGFKAKSSCLITLSKFTSNVSKERYEYDCLSLTSVEAMLKLHSICSKLNVNVLVQKVSFNDFSSYAQNEIHIDGFYHNPNVLAYLNDKFPDFKYHTERNKGYYKEQYGVLIHNDFFVYDSDFRGYEIFGTKFTCVSGKIDYAFLIKLTPEDFGQSIEKNVHILFGHTAIGTEKAIEYLVKHYNLIYKQYKDKHYFLVLEINLINNSINFFNKPLDFTSQIFR